MKKGKKYQAALAKIDAKKVYTIEEACALVKETSTVKFDATIDVAFRLNVDPKQADQQLRGTLTLPHGNGKTKKILAVTNTKTEEATAAGADFVGGKEILEKVKNENWFDYDVIVATPDMMGELKVVCDTILKIRPQSVKGVYIKNCALHTVMGPSIKFTFEGR